MHLLMTTFAFLLLFSIFSIAQLRLLQQDIVKEHTYNACMCQVEEEEINKINDKTSYLLTQYGQKSDPVTKRTSRLHISSLVQDKNGAQNIEEAKWAKKILCDLITELYQGKKFFKDAYMTPKRVDELVTLLFQIAEDLPTKDFYKNAHTLSNVHLDDPILREVFYKMMKGNPPPKDQPKSTKENYKSLEEYISFEKKGYIMSLYLAPEELLTALFHDQALVDDIITLRSKIYAEQQRQTRQKKSQNNAPQAEQNTELDKLKMEFENLRAQLPSGMPPHLVDFNISGSNPKAR